MVFIQFLVNKNESWVPVSLPLEKREKLRMFLRQSLDKSNFRRNAFAAQDIWIQNTANMVPINELKEQFTIQLRRMRLLKKNKYIQDGHFVFPNWRTANQQSGICKHDLGLVLKIAEGYDFTEEKFNFYV